MTTPRRRLALTLIAAGLAASAGLAHAWPWGGERVDGSGQITAEQRDPGAFDGVSLAGDFKVTVRQAGANHVEIKTDANLLPYIETRIVDNGHGRTLEIGTKRGYNLHATGTPQVTLDMPALRAISIAGSGDVKVGAIKGGEVSASISGSGDLTFEQLDADALKLSISGSGDVKAAGHARDFKVSVSGSGDVTAPDFAADDVKISVAGSGDALVRASKTLSITVAGQGDVSYHGAPVVTSSIAGAGRVTKLDN